jgi:hypothetical protein
MNTNKREITDRVLKYIFRTTGFLTIALLGGIFLSSKIFLEIKSWLSKDSLVKLPLMKSE